MGVKTGNFVHFYRVFSIGNGAEIKKKRRHSENKVGKHVDFLKIKFIFKIISNR